MIETPHGGLVGHDWGFVVLDIVLRFLNAYGALFLSGRLVPRGEPRYLLPFNLGPPRLAFLVLLHTPADIVGYANVEKLIVPGEETVDGRSLTGDSRCGHAPIFLQHLGPSDGDHRARRVLSAFQSPAGRGELVDNDQDGLRFSAGAPPSSADGTWQTPTAPPPPARRGITPGAVAVIAAAVLVAGIGGGYLAFHKDTPAAPRTIQEWSSDGGKTRMAEFSADIDELDTAASAEDSNGVHKACVALQSTVESAQAYQPMPDAQAQASWAAALAAYARAAADCIAGTDRLDATLINQSNDELGTGNTSLQQVAARINQITGS